MVRDLRAGYPTKKKVEVCFQKVLGELEQLLPELHKTRWRKKSDFYSLFLVFAAHVDELPLTKTGRIKAHKSLTNFGAVVDAEISIGSVGKVNKQLKTYVEAVEKAASDLAQRVKRQEIIEEILAGVFA